MSEAPVSKGPEDAPARLGDVLQRLVPKAYADHLLHSVHSTTRERRLVTCLFSDVKAFTEMSGRLDPEDVLEIMNGALEHLLPPIYRHEGTLAHLMGDAILAFFGAPIAHEDDPERAIRAGLEILAGVREYADRLEEERGIHGFNVRVGINTGLVVVGELGSDLRVEYTAMGDAVNLAARMEQNAPVGGLLITHDTYRHVRGVFEVVPQIPLAVKGKADPVQTYLVQGIKPRASRIQTRGVEGVETRTIGREAELKVLQNAFVDAFVGHETKVVTVSGEAGVGKSRLLYEFANWAELRPERYGLFKGRAREDARCLPGALLKDMLADRLEILENDRAEVAMAKFRDGMAGILEPDQADLVGQWAGFDFLAAGSRAVSDLLGSPDLAQMAVANLEHYLRRMAAKQPLLMMLEDLHWADERSLDFLDHLATQLPQERLLLVALTRPELFERRPSWGEGREAYVHLPLKPLSRFQSQALVDEILQKADPVPDDLRVLIAGSAEGNPFYLEELVKMLIEDGVIDTSGEPWRVELPRVRELRVPPTLTGVLQARLDSLPREARDVLQRASVVGRVFWDDAVAALVQDEQEPCDPNAIGPLLDSVRERELVSRRETSSFAGSREYSFKHMILRDVTYETVLLKLRRAYHRQVAQWIEANAGDRVGEYTGLIAEHYERAGEGAMAGRWLVRMAKDGLDITAWSEALHASTRALRLLPEEEKRPQAEALAHRGEARARLGDGAGADQDLEVALRLSRELNDPGLTARVELSLCLRGLDKGDVDTWPAYAEEALRLARAAKDRRLEAHALRWVAGAIFLTRGSPQVVRQYLEESMALHQEVGPRWGIGGCLINLGELHRTEGDYASAARYYEQALQECRKTGSSSGQQVSLFNLGEVATAQGDLEHAASCYREGLAVAEKHGIKGGISHCQAGLGHCAIARGDMEGARRSFRRALSIAAEAMHWVRAMYALLGFAHLKMLAGQSTQAAEWVGLIRSHPGSDIDETARVEILVEKLRGILPSDDLDAALARGAKLELDKVVGEALAESKDWEEAEHPEANGSNRKE